MSTIKVTAKCAGSLVEIEADGTWSLLTPQEAHELHQALGEILPELAQPFKEREQKP